MLKPSPRQFSLAVALALGCSRAGAVEQAQPSLVDFSIGQLSDIVVTSVSRQDARLADAPASIYAISAAPWVIDARTSSSPGAPHYSIACGAQFDSEAAKVHRVHPELGAPGVRQLIERAAELKLALRF
ncbi:MAG: hypothetical protein JWP34_1861 [Massilia sp.]|jgi:hypothetical protein|nr:hypothetical protein [Massilia sp.]